MQPPILPRTLILDYYDSYTNNLLCLFTHLYSDAEVLQKVVVIKADKYTWTEFQEQVLPNIDCVILSPGPGRPDNPSDIGFGLDLLRSHPIPILGVCLGHQAIGVAFAAKIINTPRITHGHVVSVSPVIPFKGLFDSPLWQTSGTQDEFEVVVYNSLTVDPQTIPDELEVTAWSIATADRPSTVQGLRHKQYPIWGVQYHPESISSTRGSALLQSFLANVNEYHSSPSSFPPLPPQIISSCAYRVSAASKSRPSSALPTPPVTPSPSRAPSRRGFRRGALRISEKKLGDLGKELRTQDVFESLVKQNRGSRKGKERAIGEVWLDGQTPTRSTTTSLAAPSFLLSYSLATRTVTLHQPSLPPTQLTLSESTTFWDWFSSGAHALTTALSTTPSEGLRGGWTGYFGYEMKVESLQGYKRPPRVESSEAQIQEVDACWGWVDCLTERTSTGEWIAQGIIQDGIHLVHDATESDEEDISMVDWLRSHDVAIGISQEQWEDYIASVKDVLSSPQPNGTTPANGFPTFRPSATGSDYRGRIDACREAIRQGESYELTLTTRFSSSCPASTDPYSLYLRLRTFNPAYYSTYMHFPTLSTPRGHGLSILSSSPERFLKIDKSRRVEMMPIKGTRARVKPGRRVDTKIGDELRSDLKERAENLMIVDLIRSDLLSCCTPSTVSVPKLIALESYGVHNLVTTVQGTLAGNVGSVECVRRCFPPGSMTGAPKLRSVQILDDLEGEKRRGIYSGCLGYFSIDGVSDLSVVIRTIVAEGEHLSIGAGGAITWLSNRDSEWEEVLTKVGSVVGKLDDV
uniref:aminodeoxychorismate synthase n=1 Tax=Kwoniella bestiolae CBS 10118 TaxID=1296100 RepID=A0A1B9G7L0_9TREE|nr:para-aminobenzoate synthetase [Kwoniella bestiolae CBS 10118]OCF27017.1 para-aminobenzoate synthetase [Kwoniella bestiolae CBS 10118]